MPKQGVTSMFSYGTGYGILQGVVGAFGFPFTLVPPRVWTKVMHAGVSTDISAKEKSLVAALRLFPDQNFLATPRSTKPHQGLIDACLINEYGRRVLGANQETLRALVSTSA